MAKKTVSLADKAYEIIKTNIINLTYPPGMPLTESMLSEELHMSRNPIRAAIRTLQSEGLIVVSDYHKSMTVKKSQTKIFGIFTNFESFWKALHFVRFSRKARRRIFLSRRGESDSNVCC